MSKIAEAWERLEREIITHDHRDECKTCGLAIEVKEWGRALALAVLEKAEREASEHVSDFLLDKDDLGFADWTLHLEALREEINELGGEVDA